MILVSKIEDVRDLDAAFTIREKVFVEEQGVPTAEEYDQYERTAHHYLATCAGVPCGAARWRQTEKGIKLERFAVLPEYRNQEVGSHLLHKVLLDVKAMHPGKEIYLHAQLPALNFYARHGFAPVGEPFSECDIEHYKMILRD
ncbi:MAG: family acetyltransferase [Adhaeribacter sp.]|nr:family acetyltransferase [Adhaeribacter sp.]